jgi:hypothetical protein
LKNERRQNSALAVWFLFVLICIFLSDIEDSKDFHDEWESIIGLENVPKYLGGTLDWEPPHGISLIYLFLFDLFLYLFIYLFIYLFTITIYYHLFLP